MIVIFGDIFNKEAFFFNDQILMIVDDLVEMFALSQNHALYYYMYQVMRWHRF